MKKNYAAHLIAISTLWSVGWMIGMGFREWHAYVHAKGESMDAEADTMDGNMDAPPPGYWHRQMCIQPRYRALESCRDVKP